jgi:HEAT repeat protein
MPKTLLQRLFKIGKKEWPRVGISWSIWLLWKISAIMVWTIFTVLIVDYFGISNLPLFYIIHAALIIVGTLAFAAWVGKNSTEKSLIYLSGAAIVSVTVAIILRQANSLLFLVIGIGAYGILYSQIHIHISLFQKQLFTPLESIRTFPIIQSAETVGALLASAILITLVGRMEVFNMLFIALLILAGIIPLMYWFVEEHHKSHPIQKKQILIQPEEYSYKYRLRQGLQSIKKTEFLKGILLVVVLYWIFSSVLEFQFTKVVEANIGPGIISHQQALTGGLSRLIFLFSSLGLLMQLLIASRVIGKLGIMMAMLLHSSAAIFFSGGMLMNFGYATTIAARANMEGTGVIFRLAYDESYYALKEKLRNTTKEAMDGIFRPIGIILGTASILILQQLLEGPLLNYGINLILISSAVAMMVLLLPLKAHFTSLSQSHLEEEGDSPSKFDAIEVLAQKGHKDAQEILLNSLIYKSESDWLKKKILKALGKIQSHEALPEIIKILESDSDELTVQALKTIQQFDDLDKDIVSQAFSRYRLVNALHSLYDKTDSLDVREQVMIALSKINDKDVVHFLLRHLEQSSPTAKANVLYAMKDLNDTSVEFYAEPFLSSSDPWLKAHSIITIWNLKPYRLKTIEPLNQLLEEKHPEAVMAGIFVLGEIKMTNEVHRLQGFCKNEDPEVRFYAALALAKMGYPLQLKVLMPILTSKNKCLARKAHGHLESLHQKIQEEIQEHLNYEIIQAINKIGKQNKGKVLEEYSDQDLRQLLHYYHLLGDEKESMDVEKALKKLSR